MIATHFPTGMKVRQFTPQFKYSIIALILMSVFSVRALTQDGHSHTLTSHQGITQDQKGRASELIKIVRESTERFQDVAEAERAGYSLTFGCVSGPDSGAMGLHFVNFDLLGKGVLDPTAPQIVIYEAQSDGHLKLIGADFLVFAAPWDKAHPGNPPELMGQLFHYFESPNRFGLEAFYTLHVWAWKDNPNGAFVNWHPNVSCQNFTGQTTQ
jgi:hypothetical protein